MPVGRQRELGEVLGHRRDDINGNSKSVDYLSRAAPTRLKCRAKRARFPHHRVRAAVLPIMWRVARVACFSTTQIPRTACKAPSTTATTIRAEAMSELPLIRHMNATAKISPTPIARLFQVKTRFIWRSFDKTKDFGDRCEDCTCKKRNLLQAQGAPAKRFALILRFLFGFGTEWNSAAFRGRVAQRGVALSLLPRSGYA